MSTYSLLSPVLLPLSKLREFPIILMAPNTQIQLQEFLRRISSKWFRIIEACFGYSSCLNYLAQDLCLNYSFKVNNDSVVNVSTFKQGSVCLLYWFPIVVVTNYHKFSGLKLKNDCNFPFCKCQN